MACSSMAKTPRASSPKDGAPDERFRQLLQELAEEHECELQKLRRECEELRAGMEAKATEPSSSASGAGKSVKLQEATDNNNVCHIVSAGEGDDKDYVDFQLNGCWQELHIMANRRARLPYHIGMSEALTRNLQDTGFREAQEEKNRKLTKEQTSQRCLINPGSMPKVVWDMFGLVLIGYDFIFIPMQVFPFESNTFVIVMQWITLLFWSGDLIMSFFVAYWEKGELVTDRKRILVHYMKTWFLVDAIVVIPDWITKFLGGPSGLGRVFRALRAMRVLRLLRLAKVQKMMNMLYDRLDSEYSFICVDLARLLGFILILNHVIACLWYGLGSLTDSWGWPNWVKEAGLRAEDPQTLIYRYTTSMHWSLTQFTPAGMEVSARNVAERIFSVTILFFAMVAFSSVIGSVSASMSALRNMKGGQLKEFWSLRRYLRQRKISDALSIRVGKYLEHRCSLKDNMVQPKNIPMLVDLSDQLTRELAYELHSPHLSDHPLFSHYTEHFNPVMWTICHKVVKQVCVASRDCVFSENQEATNMYFLVSGLFEYIHFDGSPMDPPLRTRAWIAEPILWTSWRHRGNCNAVNPSQLVAVPPAPFIEVVRQHPTCFYIARSYGRQFVQILRAVPLHALSDVIFSDDIYSALTLERAMSNPEDDKPVPTPARNDLCTTVSM